MTSDEVFRRDDSDPVDCARLRDALGRSLLELVLDGSFWGLSSPSSVELNACISGGEEER